MTSVTILLAVSLFLVLGTPVAFAMGITAIIGILLTGDNLVVVAKVFYESISKIGRAHV